MSLKNHKGSLVGKFVVFNKNQGASTKPHRTEIKEEFGIAKNGRTKLKVLEDSDYTQKRVLTVETPTGEKHSFGSSWFCFDRPREGSLVGKKVTYNSNLNKGHAREHLKNLGIANAPDTELVVVADEPLKDCRDEEHYRRTLLLETPTGIHSLDAGWLNLSKS